MAPSDNDHDPPTTVGTGAEPTTQLPSPRQATELAWSAEEPTTLPLRQSWRLTWGRAAMLLACAGVVALAIGFSGWALMRMQDDAVVPMPEATPPASWGAPPPPAWMTTVATTPTTTMARLSGRSLPGTDDLGWTTYQGARCDSGSKPAVMARTTKSVLVVCEIQPGDFYYRGVRLSDGASIELANAVHSSEGFDVTNPNDGTIYRIRPMSLTIAPPDAPAWSEPMLQYAAR